MFSSAAVRIITKYTQGIPRNINNVCFNAMSIAFVQKQRTIDERIILEVIDDLDLKTRSNTAAQVPALENLRPGQLSPDNNNSALPDSNFANATPATASVPAQASLEDRVTPMHNDEWIVEFSPSDVASLSRSKQQKREGASLATPPLSRDVQNTSPTALDAENMPPQAAVARAGASSHSNPSVTDGSPTPQVARRIVSGTKKPPRKESSWRSVGSQIVLVILLFVTLGWLATQARRRAEAHVAPKVPVGVLVFPSAPCVYPRELSEMTDVSAVEHVASHSGNFSGAAS
jgi:hypothetical protein